MGHRPDVVVDVLDELVAQEVHVPLALGPHVLVDGLLELLAREPHRASVYRRPCRWAT
jgi:hypothetical protein